MTLFIKPTDPSPNIVQMHSILFVLNATGNGMEKLRKWDLLVLPIWTSMGVKRVRERIAPCHVDCQRCMQHDFITASITTTLKVKVSGGQNLCIGSLQFLHRSETSPAKVCNKVVHE